MTPAAASSGCAGSGTVSSVSIGPAAGASCQTA